MFVVEGRPNEDGQKKPIKVWLQDIDNLDANCLEQALNLADLPFIHKWVALMPDTHMGYGMPIGGVIAARGIIIPNAVGVDIGCGMAFLRTNIPVELIRSCVTSQGPLAKVISSSILRDIPVGFAHHKEPQKSAYLDGLTALGSDFAREMNKHPELTGACFPSAFRQLGTLGGGNHL